MKNLTRTLSNGAGEMDRNDATAAKKVVDGCVESRPPADFREHRRGNANQRTTFVCHRQDSARLLGKHRPLGRSRQRIHRFGVQDQRFGHARPALVSSVVATGPCNSSSSPRKA